MLPEPVQVPGGGERRSFGDQEGVGGQAEGGMVVKASPASSLERPPPQFLFAVLVVALHSPAQMSAVDQSAQRRVGRQSRYPVWDRFWAGLRPLDQQPLRGAPFPAQVVPMCRTHSPGGAPRTQHSGAPLAPTHRAKGRGQQRFRQRGYRHRLVSLVPAQPRGWSSPAGTTAGWQGGLAWRPHRPGFLHTHHLGL